MSSHIPWPNEDRVYSRGGVPIMEKMATLLGDNHVKEVSGVCVCLCVCVGGVGAEMHSTDTVFIMTKASCFLQPAGIPHTQVWEFS